MADKRPRWFWWTACGASVVALLGFMLAKVNGAHLTIGQVIFPGIMALVLLNILLFVINSLVALRSVKRSDDEDTVEQKMAPALQGKPEHLGPQLFMLFQLLFALNVGEIIGSVIFVILRLVRIA
jgi:hypothetical protein